MLRLLSDVPVALEDPDKLARFREKEGLTYPLLGDTDLEVLDIGGGTGGFAVRVAELGHHEAARTANRRALELTDNPVEQDLLRSRIGRLGG